MFKISKRFSLVEREQIVDKASRCLWLSDGKLGRDYLLKTRKLSKKVVKNFRLGYIPNFVKHQLRGRIIFPVNDPSGNLIAISSRKIDSSKSFLPVYWHESYEKSFYLYGSDLARSFIRKYGFVLVCEGQIDVLQMHNHGVCNVVGLSGNKMSSVQISIAQRYCDEIILLLDTDENQAGQIGANKIISRSSNYTYNPWSLEKFPIPINIDQFHVAPVARKIMSVTLPGNLDPDEFVCKYGIQKLKQIIQHKRNSAILQ